MMNKPSSYSESAGLKAKVHFYQKSKGRREKGKKHTQVQRSDFRDSAKVKQLRQIKAEMV